MAWLTILAKPNLGFLAAAWILIIFDKLRPEVCLRSLSWVLILSIIFSTNWDGLELGGPKDFFLKIGCSAQCALKSKVQSQHCANGIC